MSKELEALRNFISECENDWKTQPNRLVDGAINSNVSKYMDSLKSILTPPTADEVCEALSKYMKEEVKYIPHRLKKNGFYLVDSGIYLVSLGYDNQVNFSCNDWIKFNTLPPSLITLIGRFYEGLGK